MQVRIQARRERAAFYGALMAAAMAVSGSGGPASAQPWEDRLPDVGHGGASDRSDGPRGGLRLAQAGSLQRGFGIPAQPLASALTLFGQQSGLQVSVDGALVRGLSTSGVQGRMTAERAVQRLLAGTGLSYDFVGTATIVIQRPGADGSGPVDGELLERITVESPSGSEPGDEPFRTPGSSAYISGEQIERVRPSSPGDIFRDAPGVLSGSNHNGPAIDVNIRGVQGHNRVKVMVEGTQQESSSYRGYAGPDNRTYVDPELIGGIEIEKGPGSGPYGAGTTAGVVNVRLLGADDIVRDGQLFGARLRGGVGNNAVGPRFRDFIIWQRNGDGELLEEGGEDFTHENWFGSFAGAIKDENFEVVAAYARQKQGNYFSGTHGPTTYDWTFNDFRYPLVPGKKRTDTVEYAPKAIPGGEVPNTAKETTSWLLKGVGRLDGGHTLELGALDYKGEFGRVFPSLVRLYPLQQYGHMRAESKRYWSKYTWDPDNDLIAFNANVWTALSEEGSVRSGAAALETSSWGTEVWNASKFETPIGGVALSYGGSYASSSLTLPNRADGTRRVAGGYADAALAPFEWLTFNAGLRYDHFDSDGYSERRVCNWSVSPPCVNVKREGTLQDSAVSPRLGVTIEPIEGLQLFAQYSEGFRPPSIVETSGSGPSGNFEFNPDLRPERLESWELGVNVLHDGLLRADDAFRAKLVYFDNTHTDYIVRGPVPGTRRDLQFLNIPGANIKGFEASVSYDVGFLFASVGFNYLSEFEYCYERWRTVVVKEGTRYRPKPELVPDDCHDVAFVSDWQNSYMPPQYTGSATLGMRLFDQSLVLGARVSFHGEAVLPMPEESGLNFPIRWSEAQIVDLFGSYTFNDRATLGFSVENLTDRFYVSPLAVAQIPSPGRTARVDFTLRF